VITNKELDKKTHFNALSTMLIQPPAKPQQAKKGLAFESVFEEVMRSPPIHFNSPEMVVVDLAGGKKVELCWYDSLIDEKNRS
jgi:hypothetical protein